MDTAVTRRQKLHLVAKEARVGFFNGLILGVLSFFCIGLYLMLLKGQTPLLSFAVSFYTGVAPVSYTHLLIALATVACICLLYLRVNFADKEKRQFARAVKKGYPELAEKFGINSFQPR